MLAYEEPENLIKDFDCPLCGYVWRSPIPINIRTKYVVCPRCETNMTPKNKRPGIEFEKC